MKEISLNTFGLSTDYIGLKCLYFDEIESTNSYLLNNSKNFESGTVIAAGYQTQGKGRLDRCWYGEKDKALMFSILLKKIPEKIKTKIVFATAIAIKLVINKLYNTRPSIKWPNDIYLEDRKISGILCQSSGDDIIIGIGINVNQESFENEIKDKASSLLLITGQYYEIFKVLANVLNFIEKTLITLEKEGFSTLRLEILKNFQYLDQTVEVISGNEIIRGINKGINEEGALLVEVKGKIKNIVSGDVSLCLLQ